LKDKFILSRDVTFDEALSGDSQQAEGKKTEGISQQKESDATLLSLERSVLFKTIPMLTHGGGHIADQDVDDYENQR